MQHKTKMWTPFLMKHGSRHPAMVIFFEMVLHGNEEIVNELDDGIFHQRAVMGASGGQKYWCNVSWCFGTKKKRD